MQFLSSLFLLLSWISLGFAQPINTNTEVQRAQVEARGMPYCVFPWRTRPMQPRTFTTHFRSDPIGYARTFHRNPAWISAGNTLMNYRIREVPDGIRSLDTVIEVQAPDPHPAIHNYNIEVRRVPASNPNAAGDCFMTGNVRQGSRNMATLRWRLDSDYIYYLTIEETI